jgi:hypothetical protein
MRRSTVILLAGFGLSAVIGSGAYISESRESAALSTALKRCPAEFAEEVRSSLPPGYTLDASNPEQDELACAPWSLRTTQGPLTNAQRRVVAADAGQEKAQLWFQGALLLFGISAGPWAWYFLLRRIAELRAAISGKPPSA